MTVVFLNQKREIPHICRGDSKSLTFQGSTGKFRVVSRQAHTTLPMLPMLPMLWNRPLLRSFGGIRNARSVCRSRLAPWVVKSVKRWYAAVPSNSSRSALAIECPMSSMAWTGSACLSDHSLTPFRRVASQSLTMPFGVPARVKIPSKSAATLSPLTLSLIFKPMHSQSPSRIAAPRFNSASSRTRKTTRAFLVPMSMEWSMIASQGASIAVTCPSSPKPSRNVQLMTEVKCGTQPSPGTTAASNNPSIRGTLRYDTTACTTSKTHNARVSAGWRIPALFTAARAVFFCPRPLA